MQVAACVGFMCLTMPWTARAFRSISRETLYWDMCEHDAQLRIGASQSEQGAMLQTTRAWLAYNARFQVPKTDRP